MRTQHLYVVVPGIAGSVLETPEGKQVWGHLGDVISRVAWDPCQIGIERFPELSPVKLLPRIGVACWTLAPGYGPLVASLKQQFGLQDADITTAGLDASPDASVLLVPYDFRQDVKTSSAVLQRAIDNVRGDRQVVILAHSMGGLVARWWWALGGHAHCAGFITIGTPHRGAPKALSWLVNGTLLVPRAVRAPVTRITKRALGELRQWPAAYDLLPRYPAIVTGDDEQIYPYEFADAYSGFETRARAAFSRHEELARTCDAVYATGDDTSTFYFYSTAHKTPPVLMHHRGRLVAPDDDPEWLPRGWSGGDQTVPSISSIPIGREKLHERLHAPETHIPMASSRRVIDCLAQFEQGTLRPIHGDPPGALGPHLGMASPELTAAGADCTIEIRARGVDDSILGAASLTAKVGHSDGTARRLVSAPSKDAPGRWSVEVPGLSAGVHTLTATLSAPGLNPLAVSTPVGVIEA